MVRSLNGPYGAFELKCAYQRNMIMGTAASVLVTALIMLSVWLYSVVTYHEIEPPDIITIKTFIDLGPPPSVDVVTPQVNIAKPEAPAARVGIPEPVGADEIVDENLSILSKNELKNINAPVFPGGGGDGSQTHVVIDIPTDDSVAGPGVFVPLEQNPVLVYEAIPDYPRLAEEGGFTAWVIVESFVGKDGSVKKARAVKTNRPNMGFEEAAVRAEYKCTYRPGIQNGNPVGAWVAHKYNFTLDR